MHCARPRRRRNVGTWRRRLTALIRSRDSLPVGTCFVPRPNLTGSRCAVACRLSYSANRRSDQTRLAKACRSSYGGIAKSDILSHPGG
jgi:hypothetical protein